MIGTRNLKQQDVCIKKVKSSEKPSKSEKQLEYICHFYNPQE